MGVHQGRRASRIRSWIFAEGDARCKCAGEGEGDFARRKSRWLCESKLVVGLPRDPRQPGREDLGYRQLAGNSLEALGLESGGE
jgi:hypothetical protein